MCVSVFAAHVSGCCMHTYARMMGCLGLESVNTASGGCRDSGSGERGRVCVLLTPSDSCGGECVCVSLH